MKIGKRLLSLLLCFVMLVGLLPTTAFAVESATVTTYSELWSAFYSNDDYTITLGNDITYTISEGGNSELAPYQYLLNVSGTKNKTLDLNGHTLQVTNNRTNWPTQSGLFNIDDTASLTVMNGTIKLYNYNNSNRTDIGVFNARGGNLTLTNVDVLNGRVGTTVNAQGNATVNIEGGTISALNGFAVTAVGSSWLVLDKGVTLTTTTGSGLITQPADNGYGSLHASTPNLSVVSAMFETGIEVAESTISQFSASANRLVFVGGNQYNSAFATSKSGDYYWDTNATGGCALVVNDNGYSFAKNVNVISTTAKQPIVVTNGTASPNQASYGATVTITAEDIPGKVFNGWTVVSGGVTLADPSAKTTTFTMGAKAVEIRADYENIPISSAEFIVTTPVAGGNPANAITNTEHITVSETWYVEKYDESTFSSTLSNDYTFEAGHTYRVGVVFELEQNYTLDNEFSVSFVDQLNSTQKPATQGASQYVWIADYTVEDNSVEITSVTATVSGADAGATAGSTVVTTNDTTYTVSIKGWYDCDNVFSYASATVLQSTDTFVGGKTYTVGITFTPVGGNTLSNSLTTSINGESGKIGGWDSGSRNYFITITVPSTQPNEYMVSYVANGGSGTMTGDMVEENGKFTLDTCTYIAPEGYQFKAWAIGSVNGEQKQPDEQITITAETYIYAIWEAIEYNVTVTGGTASVGAGTPITKATMGTTVTLIAGQAPSGQMFDKWVVNGVVVDDANSATTTFVMPAGNVTAEATYKDIPVVTYTVTFNANGGTGTMTAATVESGAEYTLPACTFTAPSGKQFKAWSVGGVEKAVGDKITVTANTTVTAVWEDIPQQPTTYTVTVTYGSGSGDYTEGANVTITAGNPPQGKVFDKWEVTGATVADVNSATTSFTMPANAVTATATYKDAPQQPTATLTDIVITTPPTKTIYTAGESFDPTGMVVTAYYSDQSSRLLSNNEYTYAPAGALTANDTKITVTYDDGLGTIKTAVQSITVSPVQQPTTYTVSFAANGGSGTMADVTGVSGEYTLPANGFTAPLGKWFKCWSVGGVEKAVGDKITVAANTTVTAVWAGNTYNPRPNYPIYINPTPGSSSTGQIIAAKTFDGGIGLSVAVTILSAMGGAWLAKKKED